MKKQQWPEVIEVRDATELLAYRSVEGAMVGEELVTEVAQYKLVKVRKFRNEATEMGGSDGKAHRQK